MKYAEHNASQLVDKIKNGYCGDETKEKYAKALDLLNELFDLKVDNVKSYGNENETDEDRKRRRSISKTFKLELIALVTEL